MPTFWLLLYIQRPKGPNTPYSVSLGLQRTPRMTAFDIEPMGPCAPGVSARGVLLSISHNDKNACGTLRRVQKLGTP